jgi:hypothetical protein
MSGARPWLRSESMRSFEAASGDTTAPPSPVVICLFG